MAMLSMMWPALGSEDTLNHVPSYSVTEMARLLRPADCASDAKQSCYCTPCSTMRVPSVENDDKSLERVWHRSDLIPDLGDKSTS